MYIVEKITNFALSKNVLKLIFHKIVIIYLQHE